MVYSDVIRTDFVRSWNSLEHFDTRTMHGALWRYLNNVFEVGTGEKMVHSDAIWNDGLEVGTA